MIKSTSKETIPLNIQPFDFDEAIHLKRDVRGGSEAMDTSMLIGFAAEQKPNPGINNCLRATFQSNSSKL